MRRLLILFVPALALMVWLVAAQLPRWSAAQPNWFAPNTPGVCAAVESLTLYQAARSDPNTGIGRGAAQAEAMQVIAEHYDAPPLDVSEPLAVQATLPGDQRGAFYVVTARLGPDTPQKTAVLYLDAGSGDARALITATDDPAVSCDFNVRAALVAAAKSPPLLLLIAYGLIVGGALVGRVVFRKIKGQH